MRPRSAQAPEECVPEDEQRRDSPFSIASPLHRTDTKIGRCPTRLACTNSAFTHLASGNSASTRSSIARLAFTRSVSGV